MPATPSRRAPRQKAMGPKRRAKPRPSRLEPHETARDSLKAFTRLSRIGGRLRIAAPFFIHLCRRWSWWRNLLLRRPPWNERRRSFAWFFIPWLLIIGGILFRGWR